MRPSGTIHSLILLHACDCFLFVIYHISYVRFGINIDYLSRLCIETLFQRLSSSLEEDVFYEVKIAIDTNNSIASINFVLNVHSPLKSDAFVANILLSNIL